MPITQKPTYPLRVLVGSLSSAYDDNQNTKERNLARHWPAKKCEVKGSTLDSLWKRNNWGRAEIDST